MNCWEFDVMVREEESRTKSFRFSLPRRWSALEQALSAAYSKVAFLLWLMDSSNTFETKSQVIDQI